MTEEKRKMLSGDLKIQKRRKGVLAAFLVFVTVIALVCAAACTGNGGKPSGGLPSGDDDEPTVARIETIDTGTDLSICDDVIYEYFTAQTEAEQIAVLQKDSAITEEKGGKPVTFSWKKNGSAKYTLYLADNDRFENAKEYTASGIVNKLDVYNLLPATTYYWKVAGTFANDESDVLHFTTSDVSVRYIYAEGATNARDLGGYGAQNGSVKYGKIFRGNLSDGIRGLTTDGKATLQNDLGIKTEIDLRTGAKQKSEYFGEATGYYKFSVGSYTDIFDFATWNALPSAARKDFNADKASELKRLFGVLANEDNYPVIIHCDNGADSTGTIAFLINAVLGVGENDLTRDFELSSFSKMSGARYRSALNEDKTAFDDTGVMQNDGKAFVAFGATLNALKTNFGIEDKPLSYAIESFLTDYVGVSGKTIENIKKIMLSDYTPSEIERVGGERQVIDLSKEDNAVNLGEIAYDSVDGIYINNISLGNSLTSIKGSDLTGIYGERELSVKVRAEKEQKIVKIPVLIVTKFISNAEELKEALTIKEQGNYGYYELKNDIIIDALENDAGDVVFDGKNGFCGIFEGKGHTITSELGNHGLFGYVSGGATIRNVKFALRGEVNVTGKTVIGDYVVGSRIENVSIEISAETADFGEDGAGIISVEAFSGNVVNGLIINAEKALINSLFGGGAYSFEGNEFNACEIKVKDIKEIARNYTDGKYVSVYLENVDGFGGEIIGTVEIVVADIINEKGANVKLNVGERFKSSGIISIESKGVKINEYKFEDGVLYLFNDRDIFGEELGETTINITFEGRNGISVRARISAVIFTDSEEITLSGTQEICVGRATNSVDLKEFGGATVYSISCNGHYFGNDANALNIDAEFRSNPLIHGSSVLTVLVGKNDKFYTLQIPVTVITEEISDVGRFNELLKSDKAEYAIYGYYKLTADLGNPKSEFNNGNDRNWQNVDGLYGFRGTLDGDGYSVTGTVFARGLFGLVGKGAVIKNLTVNAYGYANGRTVLARSIRDAAVENVIINIKSGESDSYLTEGGILTALMSHSTTYRNVEINSDGKVDTLFGCSYWNYDARKANTFANVKLNVKSIGGLLCLRMNVPESLYALEGIDGIIISYARSYNDENNVVIIGSQSELTLGEENADVKEIISVKLGDREIKGFNFAGGILTITENFAVSDIGAQVLTLIGKVENNSVTIYLGVTVVLPAEEVTLTGDREIVLSRGREYAINLGEYANATILAATLGGENVTFTNGKLTVSDEFRANPQKHGYRTLKVTVQKDGKYYNITANVLVVTKEISTIDELTAAMTAGADNVVYGYYRLTQNVGSSGAWINVENKGSWENADGSIGFRGTLDGNGFAVDGNFATHGLFGIIGNGAVVKNIKFNVYFYQNGRQTLARSITGATIEDVTINIKSIHGTLDATAEGGVITGLLSRSATYRRVTINAEGKDLDTLFGKSYGRYKADKANTFEDCVVNANSLAGLIHSGDVIPATGITGLKITENIKLNVANEIVLSSGTEYAINLGEYANATIESATLGGEKVTFVNGKLTVSDEFRANTQNHGYQTLSVTVLKDGKYYNITANVLVVTKDISTIEELTAATTAGADNVVYGYYRLTQNVGSSGAWINVENKGDWKNADGSIGFRGTLDGNGFAVDGAFATHGLFGIIGNGAVVKNITFNVYYYQNGRGTLASSITGATIEDVTINIKSIHGTLDATAEGGVITRLMSKDSTYRRVTINAEGKDLDTLFGKSYGWDQNKANAFEDCVVNAKSLAGLMMSKSFIPATGITGLTLNTES